MIKSFMKEIQEKNRLYVHSYFSPLGKMIVASDDKELFYLKFEDSITKNLSFLLNHEEKLNPVIELTFSWLDIYFSHRNPTFPVPLHKATTNFQEEVRKIIQSIPYGKTLTYGEIAKDIARKKGQKEMSAQAIGSSCKKNPICLIVPCHRVIGSNGNLVGYSGGNERKKKLLEIEGWKN